MASLTTLRITRRMSKPPLRPEAAGRGAGSPARPGCGGWVERYDGARRDAASARCDGCDLRVVITSSVFPLRIDVHAVRNWCSDVSAPTCISRRSLRRPSVRTRRRSAARRSSRWLERGRFAHASPRHANYATLHTLATLAPPLHVRFQVRSSLVFTWNIRAKAGDIAAFWSRVCAEFCSRNSRPGE